MRGRHAKLRKPPAQTPTVGGDIPWLTVVGARHNNLKNINVDIPLQRFVCVTGVSGSGKSSLVNDIVKEALTRDLNGSEKVNPGLHETIKGIEHLDKVIDIDQSPIGRTPRSNPATYVKVFDHVRSLFTMLPDSKVRGYKPGRFSFNVATGSKGGGRCEACEGNGANKMEMELLADLWVPCPLCGGKRFNRETLHILYKGKSIADVLDMDVQQALDHFEHVPKIANMLRTLHDVGLDYIKLGQSSTTLSGGEAQRIKLARELAKRSTGRTLYILDEPTTGLHFHDIKKLLLVLHGFVDSGNSVLVIEHNLDVIKTADWVIDLGPEGGEQGGKVLVAGTPEKVAQSKRSFTGEALKEVLAKNLGGSLTNGKKRDKTSLKSKKSATARSRRQSDGEKFITVIGANQHNLKDVTVKIPRGKTTVCTGPSGSGKSSFAIDTVYTEGQRRYIESLSAYARQFLGQLTPPKVDQVHGLSPAICIEQKNTSSSPRSTVGTVTEIYDYMRVLWARLGQGYCPKCEIPIGAQSSEQIVDRVLIMGESTRVILLAPIEPGGNETYQRLLERMKANGYRRVRIDGVYLMLDDQIDIDAKKRHTVEIVVDRIIVRKSQASRITDSVEQALAVGDGVMIASLEGSDSASNAKSAKKTKRQRPTGRDYRFSQHRSCNRCGRGFDELTPHHFSFNSRMGWCESCEGLGVQQGTGVSSIVIRPTQSIAEGAIAGWGVLEAGSKLCALANALADHIGFDLHAPWNSVAESCQLKFLQGCGEAWIEAAPEANARRTCDLENVRFQWRGFYPSIARATRSSWQYRKRLEELVTDVPCQACGGSRLQPVSAAVRVGGATPREVCNMPLDKALDWFTRLRLDAREKAIAGELLHEITSRLRFLCDVGLDYVTLHRMASTLSGGEAQRIQLASQIGTGLTGLLYVLDEPTIGLHPRDTGRLVSALKRLRDLGNTLLVVEHDREVIAGSDHVLDFGPGAGSFGGRITAEGTPSRISRCRQSLTGKYLSGRESIPVPSNRRALPASAPRTDLELTGQGAESLEVQWLTVHGARENNLQEIDVSFPLGRFTCVTGVSGSGKSTLVSAILYQALAARIHRARTVPGGHDRISGVEYLDKVINVDQTPIGNSPTSNPATYTSVFDVIRELFARLPLSKVRGYTANRFSFNRTGGRCEACTGMGQQCIEMHFLPDVWVECENCKGKRYVAETLEVQYRGRSIADVLEMRVFDALELFTNVPKIQRMLKTLDDVGLGYVQLGQPAPTLSGGEAQRVKLATELGRPSTGKTLYILDEPTTGLHFDDLKKLLSVLHRLVDLGNTCICIEHNLDVIKTADWVVDLGPDAGEKGGQIIAEGTPERLARVAGSHTGVALQPILAQGPVQERKRHAPKPKERPSHRLEKMNLGKEVLMPWQRDGRTWHTVDHLDSQGQPVRWDTNLLLWFVETIESVGNFVETDWNHRTRVEITAAKNKQWFAHFLTGGNELLEIALRVPDGTFNARKLASRIKVKTLDERSDLPIYGRGSRARVSPVGNAWQAIRFSLRDFKDVSKTAFRKFLKEAATAYLSQLENIKVDPLTDKPWESEGQEWHLCQRAMGKRHVPKWSSTLLVALIGRFKSIQPNLEVSWNHQTSVQLLAPDQDRAVAKLVTNVGRGIRVEIRVPKGEFTPARIDRLGCDTEIKARGDQDWIIFWVGSLTECDPKQLREVWRRCQAANPGESLKTA